jgi:hypothetical protein
MEVKEGKFENGKGPSILDRVDSIGNILKMAEKEQKDDDADNADDKSGSASGSGDDE